MIMDLQKLKALQQRQRDARSTLNPYKNDIHSYRESEGAIAGYTKGIDKINRELEKEKIPIDSTQAAIQSIDASTFTKSRKEELKEMLKTKEEFLERRAKAQEDVSGRLGRRRDVASQVLRFYEAGQKGDFDEGTTNNLEEYIKSNYVDLAEYLVPDFARERIRNLLDAYDEVRIEFGECKNEGTESESRRQEYLAVIMGMLDTAVTQAWRKELVETLKHQQHQFESTARKFRATAFNSSSTEYMRIHDETYDAKKSDITARFINLMALADVFGSPPFVISHLQSLSNSPLPEETKNFMKNLTAFQPFKIRDDTNNQLENLQSLKDAAAEEYRRKMGELMDAHSPVVLSDDLMKALNDDRDKKLKLLERKEDRIAARNQVREPLDKLPGVSADSSVKGEGPKLGKGIFTLDSIAESLKNNDAPYCLVLHSNTVKEEGQPNLERRLSFFSLPLTLPLLSSRKPMSDLETSILVEKTNDRYLVYLPAFGCATFDDEADAQEFVIAAFQEMATLYKQNPPNAFEAHQVDVESLQRFADEQQLLYNKPYNDTPVAEWPIEPIIAGVVESPTKEHSSWLTSLKFKTAEPEQDKTLNYEHNYVVAVEGDPKCLEAVINLFNKHPENSTLILWNPNRNDEFKVVRGGSRPFDSESRIHLVGYERTRSEPIVTYAVSTFSQISSDTVESAKKLLDPVRTLANLPAKEMVSRLFQFVRERNKSLGADVDQMPAQVNIVNFYPVAGTKTMRPYAEDMLAEMLQIQTNDHDVPRTSTIEKPHEVSPSGHKVLTDSGKNPTPASGEKTVYQSGADGITGVPGAPKEYVGIVMGIDKVNKTIEVKEEKPARSDAKPDTAFVGDEVGKYQLGNKVNVLRTETGVKVLGKLEAMMKRAGIKRSPR